MTEPLKLTDVLARLVADGPLSLQELRTRAAGADPRAELIPVHALERLLEEDDRFVSEAGLWRLAPDAPVTGVRHSTVDEPVDGDRRAPSRVQEFVVIDVEATDPEPSRASLIEIAAVKVNNWRTLEVFETLVYTPDIPPAVSALTGITPADLETAPSARQAVANLREFIGDLPVLGQNVAYDIEVIRAVDPLFAPEVVLECLELAQIVFPSASGRALADLAAALNVASREAHRALSDCETTLEVARRLVGLLDGDDELHATIRHVLATSLNPWAGILRPGATTENSANLIQKSNAPWLTRTIEAEPRAPAAIEVFGETGLLQEVGQDADFRPAQLEMAVEVERALSESDRVLIEAPTGTGKTYAYLVPSIRASSTTGKPVWVSTNTKSLQTQLKDDFDRLKALQLIAGDLAVLKGKENYICTRDLLAATEVDLSHGAAIEVACILKLLCIGEEGEINEATDYWLTSRYPDAGEIRNTLTLNPDTCDGRNCEFIGVCPYFKAVADAGHAAVVAVNHALLVKSFSSDNNRAEIAGLVIDEAHSLEDAATSSLVEELDAQSVTAWLNRLINQTSSTGLLRNVGRGFGFTARDDTSFASSLDVVRRARKAIQLVAERMASYLSEFVGRPNFGGYPITHRFQTGIDDRRFLFLEARQALFDFAALIKELTGSLRELYEKSLDRATMEGFNGKALRRRLRAEAARGDELVEMALTLLTLSSDEYVVYATWEASEADLPALVITRAPVDVSEVLRDIYDGAPAVVATSATLSVGGTFDFMRRSLAADDFVTVQIPETFDYSSQASLILTRHLPVPSSNNEDEFVKAVADTAVAAVGTARGGTLGLFTSRKRLSATYHLAEAPIRYQGLEIKAQLPGTSVRQLATWFRDTPDGSLFGLRSFWQGFDAPGDTLRLLLIEKLPFPSPSDPLFAARSDRVAAEGMDPFYDYAVPLAALALKQGFGRLIRTKNDRGVVVILDRRVRTGLSYQREMLDSLPENLPIRYPADEEEFLKTLAADLGVEPRLDLARGVGPRRALFDLTRTTVTDRSNEEQVDRALAEILAQFQIERFRPGQEELIRAVVAEGRDVVGLLPTGAGKSLVYQAASMALDGLGIVVSPLIALMKDQVDALRNGLGFGWAYALYGGQSGAERDEIMDAIRTGGCRLLYVSPERLRDPVLARAMSGANITFVAVDEAHCVSAWGHDFRPDFLSIIPALSQLPNVENAPRIALTATAPQEVLEDILTQLKLRNPLIEKASVDRPNIHFSVIKCRNRKQKRSELLRIAMAHDGRPGIVYCPTRNRAEATAALLKSHGIPARHYHAGMPAEQREAVQEMFMSDQVQVICATNAFGLGVDKPDIAFVAHWALPLSLDAYFQEAGRAARDPGMTGTAVLLWTPSDLTPLRKMLASSLPTLNDIERLNEEISGLSRPYATIEGLSARTGIDEVSTRVGIHLLHESGAIRQGVDVAARAFIAIPSSREHIARRFGEQTAAFLGEILPALGVSAPGRRVVDVLDAAAELDMAAQDLEQKLIDLAEREVIGYRPILRAMTLEPLDTDWDRQATGEKLRALKRSSFERLEAMKTYAETKSCRRRQLLAHFGELMTDDCAFCDSCVGEPAVLTSVDPMRFAHTDAITDQVIRAIIGLVREASRLRSTPSRNSFIKGLKGTKSWGGHKTPQVLQRSRWFGALRYLTEREIEEAIDTLIDEGRIMEVEHTLANGHKYTGLDIRV